MLNDQKEKLAEWIKFRVFQDFSGDPKSEGLLATKEVCRASIYSMKHKAEHELGFYMTTSQFAKMLYGQKMIYDIKGFNKKSYPDGTLDFAPIQNTLLGKCLYMQTFTYVLRYLKMKIYNQKDFNRYFREIIETTDRRYFYSMSGSLKLPYIRSFLRKDLNKETEQLEELYGKLEMNAAEVNLLLQDSKIGTIINYSCEDMISDFGNFDNIPRIFFILKNIINGKINPFLLNN